MALTSFIPKLWSAELLVSLKSTLIYGQDGVINRDYEGEIKQYGDTLQINKINGVTISDYTRDQDMTAAEALGGVGTTLTIDQSKAFNFQIDDLDKAQMNPKVMEQAMEEAAYALRNAADTFVATKIYLGVKEGNTIGTDLVPVVLTKDTIYDTIVDLGTILDENDVPEVGRKVILPPWAVGMLEKSPHFTPASKLGDDVKQNGFIGKVSDFLVLKSNNVPNTAGTLYKIVAVHPMATTYAEQVNEIEGYRPEKRFADAVKGLHLYGTKVTRPEAVAVLTANKA